MENALELGAAPFDKPNIFDVTAQESTKSLLRPLLLQCLQYLNSQYPNSPILALVEGRFEEYYLLLDMVVESISLCKSYATISESYYGIYRDSSNKNLLITPLSVFETCMIPYIWRRLRGYLGFLKGKGGGGGGGRLSPLERIFCKWLPFGGAAYETANFITKIMYTFFNVSNPNFITYIFNIRYCRNRKGNTAWPLTPLATLMFALRFIQWWQEQNLNFSLTQGVIPEAPVDFPPANPAANYFDTDNGACPICREKPNNPVAIPTGRVFCQECLNFDKSFLQDGVCPVTLRPVSKDNVRTLFIMQTP